MAWRPLKPGIKVRRHHDWVVVNEHDSVRYGYKRKKEAARKARRLSRAGEIHGYMAYRAWANNSPTWYQSED